LQSVEIGRNVKRIHGGHDPRGISQYRSGSYFYLCAWLGRQRCGDSYSNRILILRCVLCYYCCQEEQSIVHKSPGNKGTFKPYPPDPRHWYSRCYCQSDAERKCCAHESVSAPIRE